MDWAQFFKYAGLIVGGVGGIVAAAAKLYEDREQATAAGRPSYRIHLSFFFLLVTIVGLAVGILGEVTGQRQAAEASAEQIREIRRSIERFDSVQIAFTLPTSDAGLDRLVANEFRQFTPPAGPMGRFSLPNGFSPQNPLDLSKPRRFEVDLRSGVGKGLLDSLNMTESPALIAWSFRFSVAIYHASRSGELTAGAMNFGLTKPKVKPADLAFNVSGGNCTLEGNVPTPAAAATQPALNLSIVYSGLTSEAGSWRGSGRIEAIPDLEGATLVLGFPYQFVTGPPQSVIISVNGRSIKVDRLEELNGLDTTAVYRFAAKQESFEPGAVDE